MLCAEKLGSAEARPWDDAGLLLLLRQRLSSRPQPHSFLAIWRQR